MRIVIVGAGVGGLSAAHLLAPYGEVHVYEKNSIAGGLARSEIVSGPEDPICNTTTISWRVYFHFYQYLFSLMKQIPSYDGRSAYDHLVPYRNVFIPPTNIMNELSISQKLSIAKNFCCSYERISALDSIPWIDYFGKELEIPQWLGMDKFKGSSTSVHMIGIEQRMRGDLTDYVLDGPTNYVWIDPWVKFLQNKGVVFHFNTPINRIDVQGDRVIQIHADSPISGDYYILGLPIEQLARLASTLVPQASLLAEKAYQVQLEFQLHIPNKNISLGKDINSFLIRDNPWALIVESKTFSWDPKVTEPCYTSQWSITACQANVPGLLVKKTMLECSEEECQQEIMYQMATNTHLISYLSKENPGLNILDLFRRSYWLPVISSYRDMIIREPKFSNNSGTKILRPSCVLGNNVFLSTAYSKETIDIFSMEAGCISGYMAASKLLAKVGVVLAEPVHPPRPYPWLEIFRILDRWLFSVGLPDIIVMLGIILVVITIIFIGKHYLVK